LQRDTLVGQAQGFVQRQRGGVEQAVAQRPLAFAVGDEFHYLDLGRVEQAAFARQHQGVVADPGIDADPQRGLWRFATACQRTQGKEENQPTHHAAGSSSTRSRPSALAR
jgi:hypothetical protein